MPPVGFEPTISAGERPQTYALDRAATGTGDIGGITHRYFNKTSLSFGILGRNFTLNFQWFKHKLIYLTQGA